MTEETNCGRVFERRIHNALLQSLRNDIDVIYDENDLRKKYGWESVGIDFLLVKDKYCIAIQTKYRKTRRREDVMINKFVKSLDHLLDRSDYNYVCGFWISRRKPFDDNMNFMGSRNIKCVHEFHSMDALVNNAIQEIRKIIIIA